LCFNPLVSETSWQNVRCNPSFDNFLSTSSAELDVLLLCHMSILYLRYDFDSSPSTHSATLLSSSVYCIAGNVAQSAG